MKPTIHFEDQHLLILSKPAGMLSQGEITGDVNLVDWLRGYLKRHYVGLIHRLDRNTSGLMVVAKRSKAAARLSESLRQGNIERRYLAWLEGKLDQAQQWQHHLIKDPLNNLVVVTSEPSAPLAKLTVTPLRYRADVYGGVTLAEFTLQTGRSHQIRVQAAAQGFGLLGDSKYNPHGKRFGRLALHSHFIRLPHPKSGELLEWKVELPADLCLG